MAVDVPCLCGNCFQERAARQGPCSECGYDPASDTEKYPMALPIGSILNGSYIIGRVLGQGGFGITYLAWDHKLKVRIAIKEYFPDGAVTRLHGTPLVSPVSQDAREMFSYGAQRFLDEARVLGKFLGSSGVVGVSSFFEENGTAYFTMEYVEGLSFKRYIKEHGGRISWQEALGVLLPTIDALSAVHREGIYHRDVTPDNILLSRDGKVKLIDFGSARYGARGGDRDMDVLLKAGYAPKEQYVRDEEQGPYTDIYSLAACFYAAITGYLPPESLERMKEDRLIPPSQRGVLIPQELEGAILRGLSVHRRDRFQTVEEFREAIAPLRPEQYLKIWMPGWTSSARKEPAPPPPPSPVNPTEYGYREEKPDQQDKTGEKKADTIRMWLRVAAGLAASVLVTAIFFYHGQNQTRADIPAGPAAPASGTSARPQQTHPQPQRAPASVNQVYLYVTDTRCAGYAEDCLRELGWQVETVIVSTENLIQNLEYAKMIRQSPVLAFGSDQAGDVLDDARRLEPDNWETVFYSSGLEDADMFLSAFEQATADIHVRNQEYVYSDSGETAGFYTGYVTEDKCDGWGEMQYVNGNIYAGEWSENQQNGYGTMYYADGSSQSGIWENGAFIG